MHKNNKIYNTIFPFRLRRQISPDTKMKYTEEQSEQRTEKNHTNNIIVHKTVNSVDYGIK